MVDLILVDYGRYMAIARYWARIALEEHAAGNPWQKAAALAHEAHGHHQPVPADFRHQVQRGVNAQAQQLVGTALWQVLLELAMLGHHFLGHARITQQAQQQVDGFRE